MAVNNPIIDPFSVICRGCLNESVDMKNMYEWGLADDFYTFADVPVERSERLSEMLCSRCEETLISCRDFRKLCQQSNEILRHSIQMTFHATGNQEQTKDIIQITQEILENTLTVYITTSNMESKIILPCPYKCRVGYQKKKDLLIHLKKNHLASDNFQIELKYYCSIKTCQYHMQNKKNKFFTERKFLNQHINKVHRTKEFSCGDCGKKFTTISELNRHDCNAVYICQLCNVQYETNERLLVHLMRKHPDLHAEYKSLKKKKPEIPAQPPEKKPKRDDELFYDSPKRSFATQTLLPDIKNDVTLPVWKDESERNTIQTQTVFEDLLSLKSQNSEDDSMFFETVSLSDIQTQTFPMEFGLSRKETITSETQTRQEPDFSIKETQTCVCHYDSPKINFRLFDSVNSSPGLTSTETQTLDYPLFNIKSDLLLGMSSTETQTNLDDD